MTTLEQERPLLVPAARAGTPRVFESVTGRRARIMRVAGSGAGVLALGWLVALGLAMLGAAQIPGASRSANAPVSRPARAVPQANISRALHRQRAIQAPRALVAAQPQRRRAEAKVAPRSRSAARTLRPAERSVAPSGPAGPPTPVATASPRQGWARHGWKSPPGQTRTKPANGSHGQGGSHSPVKG
jgi:hypothetical protein